MLLAFFSDGVSNDMKLQMKKPAIEKSNNGIVIDYKDKAVSVQTLVSFISMKS